MDTVSLMSFTAFAIAVGLIVVSAWIGHTIGRQKEEERKTAALADADRTSKAALQELRDENQKKIDVLNKANSNELDGLKHAHTAQIDQLNTAHLNLVDSLKTGHSTELSRLDTEHSSLIDKLNSSNNANISEMEQRRQSEIEGLRSEHQTLVETLRSDHAEALRQAHEDRDQRLKEAEQRHADEKAGLDNLIAELRNERDEVAAEAVELKATVAGLRDEIKEGKLNNMFSVSKSGEKLIRVVRSVQELASELDETSRTVTGGDYSFFDQIKDQRDRETVLSLTAGRHVDDQPDVGPDGEVDDADVPDVGDAKGD